MSHDYYFMLRGYSSNEMDNIDIAKDKGLKTPEIKNSVPITTFNYFSLLLDFWLMNWTNSLPFPYYLKHTMKFHLMYKIPDL